MIGSLVIIAAAATAFVSSLFVREILRPPKRLAGRVRPYAVGPRTALGGNADVVAPGSGLPVLVELFRPMVAGLAASLGRLLDRSDDGQLALAIRRSALFPDLSEPERLGAYRLRQLSNVSLWGGMAVASVPVLDLSGPQFLGVASLMLVVGGTRQRGALERAIETRRSRMTIEIYTVNQLLALRVRSGAGVISAVAAICSRGRGEVVGELSEALRMHRSGMSIGEAFGRIARLSPEPYCARTYSLLAIAEERGVDLADGLLALSEDVREARRESIRRSATKRRAAMLIPTIAILAPVMLLFMGAPLPQMLLGR